MDPLVEEGSRKPPPITRSRKPPEEKVIYPPFADDPVRGPPLHLPRKAVKDLNGPEFLTTTLIDYILRQVMPKDLPDHVLIGTSDSFEYFKTYNRNSVNSPILEEREKAQTLRRKFQVYNQRHYRFLAVNCHQGHFYVISVDFDLDEGEGAPPIYDVRVFDSIRRSARTVEKPSSTTHAGRFLMAFQEFLVKFVGFATRHTNFLLQNPEYILKDAVYVTCPQQENFYDCGLFAVGTLLHLVDDHSIVRAAFDQRDITNLRRRLYGVLSKREKIDWNFMCQFFDALRYRDAKLKKKKRNRYALSSDEEEEDPEDVIELSSGGDMDDGGDANSDLGTGHIDDDDVVVVTAVEVMGDEITAEGTVTAEGEIIAEATVTAEGIVEQDAIIAKDDTDDVSFVDNDGQEDEESTFVEEPEPTQTSVETQQETVDESFIPFFENKKYCSTDEINVDMDDYETISGFRFIIKKSTAISRQYKCRSHIGCLFSAPFGRKRGTDIIILKTALTHPVHCGPPAPKSSDGRQHKKRFKGRVEPIVDHVASIKDGDPVAKDVMKAAATVKGMDMTYDQAYRAITATVYEKWEQNKTSFEMVIPYLDRFDLSNEDSTVKYETDIDSSINRLFVCPGIMKKTLMYVRPVVSLDACHLKSRWKGTLYTASVKTACDELYPVAFGIDKDNESEAGWTYFLQLLHDAIECLVLPHPQPRVPYKYFSFVSDRSKGLTNALAKVFPENYHWYCTVHIARNAEKFGGQKVSRLVFPLSSTFSQRHGTYLLREIEKLSRAAAAYLNGIEERRWRSTAWQRDLTLPPRYKIRTSNMSESTNNMFEKARDGSWLFTIDTILSTVFERICTLKNNMEGRQGVAGYLVRELNKAWEDCAGYTIWSRHNHEDEFVVTRRRTSATESVKKFTLNVANCTCECGEWQDNGYPCIDAMAYFRLHKQCALMHVMADYVSEYYRYEKEYEMMMENIHPVCMEAIIPDGETQPPHPNAKRMSGRPKKKRIRKRPRAACDPEESSIVCSRCQRRGHNMRTCERIHENERELNEGGPENVATNNLDLL